MKSPVVLLVLIFWCSSDVARGYAHAHAHDNDHHHYHDLLDDDDYDLGYDYGQRYTHVVSSSHDHHHTANHYMNPSALPLGLGLGFGPGAGPVQKLRLRRDASEPAADDDTGFVDVLEIPKGYSNVHPPQKEGNVAEFNVLIFSVRDINELDMEISLEVRLQIFWKDHRLANWSLAIEPGKDYIVLHHKALQKIWLPDIYVENLKSVNQPVLMAKPASVRIYPDSLIRYSTRITLTMACKMSFYYYPTDTQMCPVEMKSYAYDDRTLKVQWTKKSSLTVISPEKVDLPNFDFNLEANQTTLVITRNMNQYSGIKIVVVLTRKLTYHLIQTYIPSALFVVVSWLSFLVPPESVPGRMAICMTTLLTLTSMFAAVRQNVPKVSYVKAIDIWMVTCIFFVFLTLLEYTVVLKLRSKIGRQPKFRLRGSSSAGQSQSAGGDSPAPGKPRNNSLAPSPMMLTPTHHGSGGVTGQQKVDVIVTPAGASLCSQQPPLITDQDVYAQAVKILEKYSWIVMIQLFLIFNLIYWPWLIIKSGYNEPHNQTVYYS